MTTLPVSQNKRRVLYRNLMIAAIALLGVLAIASRIFDVNVHGVALVVVAICAVLSFLQFNALDEVAKQAHYIAWYWGGLVALIAISVIGVGLSTDFISYAPVQAWLETWTNNPNEETSFLLGLIASPTLLMLGFAAWWAAYWLRRR
ncbi:MAG: hypothetical protein R3C30_16055 [Hyphomonadaceae bacterium]